MPMTDGQTNPTDTDPTDADPAQATSAEPGPAEATTEATPVSEASCPACPHPLDSHDTIARRFCLATENGGAPRGCLCSGKSKGMTYSNSSTAAVSGGTTGA